MWPFKPSEGLPVVRELSVFEARDRLSANGVQLVDVREPFEFEYCRIDGALLIPLGRILSGNFPELSPEMEVICYCHHGYRSRRAAQALVGMGFKRVSNLHGGIHAWALQVDPGVPTY